MAAFLTWVLLIVMGAWIVGSGISIAKTLIARKKAPASEQNKNAEKEVDSSNH